MPCHQIHERFFPSQHRPRRDNYDCVSVASNASLLNYVRHRFKNDHRAYRARSKCMRNLCNGVQRIQANCCHTCARDTQAGNRVSQHVWKHHRYVVTWPKALFK
ncbi:hypothetical protein D3C71_1789000 [compost metagenome]